MIIVGQKGVEVDYKDLYSLLNWYERVHIVSSSIIIFNI